MRAPALGACLLVLAACKGEDRPTGSNRCREQSECRDGTECDQEREICVSPRPSAEYPVMLLVSELGGLAGKLSHYTFATRPLTRSSEDNTLEVPEGVEFTGLVSVREGESQVPVKAQVVFTPHLAESAELSAPFVATSKPTASDGTNLRVILAPDDFYDVTIYPLGEDSEKLPPVRTTFSSETTARFKYQYKDLTTFAGVLVDERGNRQMRRWLRLLAGPARDPIMNDPLRPEHVVSSLGVTGDDGSFSLTVLPGVLDAREYVLEVSLFDDAPWATTIALGKDRVNKALAEGRLVIPEVPAVVELRGLVETADGKDEPDGERLPNTSITFVSTFPVPDKPGAVNDRDWCQAKTLGDKLSAFACKSRVTTTADVRGSFSTELLPGDYQLYISPSRDRDATRDRITTPYVESVETQPGGAPQGGQVRSLGDALPGDGAVFDAHGRPIENAVIRMLPLKVAVPPDEADSDAGTLDPKGEVGLFSRGSDAVSDERGEFVFPVDRGVFDFVVRPPEESGYAWFIKPNRKVSDSYHTRTFSLPAPVVWGGTVVSKKLGEGPIAGARIDAYTFVRDVSKPTGTRALLIASTVSDAQGRYTLKLPDSVE